MAPCTAHLRKRLAPALLLGVASLAGGCLTGERLWRVTPFEGAGSSERVNVWPLAYHDGDATSVLWPLFDVDEQGFALRPLVAKDGSAFSVLFPIAAWDTDAGTGWAVPFYWFEGHSGLFPLAHFGALNYVGPVWWSERSSGLFPLARFGDFSYVGPLWWRADEDGARSGLFPLAMFGSTSYVGPFWWGRAGGSFGLFPLFGLDLFGSGIDHAGPFWWRRGAEDGFEGGLFPLLDWGRGGRRFSLLPLYSHDLGGATSTRNLLLGLGHRASSQAKEESWLLPLYYHRAQPGKSDTALLPFFWKRTRGARAQVHTLLGSRAVDAESSSLDLYPLWWSNEGPSSSWRMLVPFFYFQREGDERTLITPLGGRGWSASGEDAFVNVLGPLYHHSVSRRRDEARTAFLWPLFEHHRRGAESRTNLAGLYSRSASPTGAEMSWAFGLGHAERTPTGHSRRLWPLYSWSNDEDLPGPLYRLTLFNQRERPGARSTSLFPLFASSRGATGSQWDVLLGLVHHGTEGTAEARVERSWAWPLYSRSQGERSGFAERTTLLGSSRWAGGRELQLGASLLYSSSRTEDATVQRARSRALLFFTHEEERFVGAHVPSGQPLQRENRVQHESRGFLFDAFVSERDTYRVWRAGVLDPAEAGLLRAYSLERGQEGLPERSEVQAVLGAHGVAPAGDDPESLRAAIQAFAGAHTRELERRHVRIPLVYTYECAPDELEWSAPLGLLHYERDPEHRRFSLLYYGYRSETRGERTRRDIFPFVTWDSGPDETRVSFLWRLFRYERHGERRGGHVLFVPWGDA